MAREEPFLRARRKADFTGDSTVGMKGGSYFRNQITCQYLPRRHVNLSATLWRIRGYKLVGIACLHSSLRLTDGVYTFCQEFEALILFLSMLANYKRTLIP